MFRPLGHIQGHSLIQRDDTEGHYISCHYQGKRGNEETVKCSDVITVNKVTSH
jgi:hypothetical protein